MRVNVYAKEMTNKIQVIGKEIDGQTFTGVRFYLELPANVGGKQYQGPFMHHPGDNDSSAVTFWGKKDLRTTLQKAMNALEQHYGTPAPEVLTPPAIGEHWQGQGGVYAGIARNHETGEQWHVILATDPLSIFSGEWGGYGETIEGASSTIDGQANTLAVMASGHDHPIIEQLKKWNETGEDGHHDFYIPSQKEQMLLYVNLQHQAEPVWHWSSTQYSAHYAWVQDFEGGGQSLYGKDGKRAARAVRRLPI